MKKILILFLLFFMLTASIIALFDFTYYGIFDKNPGLKRGMPVLYQKIKVGKISQINISKKGKIVAVLSIDRKRHSILDNEGILIFKKDKLIFKKVSLKKINVKRPMIKGFTSESSYLIKKGKNWFSKTYNSIKKELKKDDTPKQGNN